MVGLNRALVGLTCFDKATTLSTHHHAVKGHLRVSPRRSDPSFSCLLLSCVLVAIFQQIGKHLLPQIAVNGQHCP